MNKNILITGGNGLVGRYLTRALQQQGYSVSHLARKPGKDDSVKTFLWNVEQGTIDAACIKGIHTIIHLAGEGIVEKRWSDDRKKALIESRTKSIALVYGLLRGDKNHQVKSVVSASATGYYGDRNDELLTEESVPGNNFLSDCCILWEKAVDAGLELGLRVVKFRTGVVLTKEGGALPQLATPVKLLIGSPLGNGKQWVPWIHLQDVVGMYVMGIKSQTLNGAYNMAAPNPVTNQLLTQAVAKQLHKPLWAPKVPAFVIKALFGEMALVVLGSTKVSSQKIEQAGFKFSYPDVQSALAEIYK